MSGVLERRFAEMGPRVALGARPWRSRSLIDERTDAEADRLRRRNAAFVHQGEWFFVPTALWPEPLAAQVLRDAPLRRGCGNAPVLQFAFRPGGEVAWVGRRHPTGIGEAAYARNPRLYAKGAVRHPDHATIHLACWHRVFMNTEQRAQAMRHVAFLD
jgi:hypothetical protein